MNVKTRVRSASYANARSSNSTPTCSSYDSGTPTGAVGTVERRVGLTLGLLNAPFDFPDVLEILVEPDPIGPADAVFQPRQVLG